MGTEQTERAELTNPKGVWEHKDEVQILDVREPYEWEAGRIEDAVHVPLNEVMGGAGEFDQDKPVVVVCRSGNRSELATLMLRARGLEAYNLEGGMEAWEQEKLPFSAADGGPGRVA
ncbi:MAG: rhodanese-like domain-containing protein [Actinomycetota bacterium]